MKILKDSGGKNTHKKMPKKIPGNISMCQTFYNSKLIGISTSTSAFFSCLIFILVPLNLSKT